MQWFRKVVSGYFVILRQLPKLTLLALFVQDLTHAASTPASDSLILKEIADSLKVEVSANATRIEGGRVTYLSIFYRGQRGAIPPALGGLDSLRHIYMGITSVTSLPKEIGQLKRMDTINIGSSNIGPTLPDEIGELSNLRCLRVHSCKLVTLPKSIMKLQKLEAVDFTRNAICQMDDSLRQWILSKWPKALDNQNMSKCLSSVSGLRQPFTGGPPLRRLSVPGVQDVLPRQDRASKDIQYYSPLGRSLRWQERLLAPGSDSRE